jgi:hypothetical protein
MRFLDELISKGIKLPPQTVVITADEVARYLYEQMPEVLGLDDFMNIAPPFEFMAVECLLTGVTRDGRGGRIVTTMPTRRSVWISQNVEVTPGSDPLPLIDSYLAALERVGSKFTSAEREEMVRSVRQHPPRWLCSISVFDEALFDKPSYGRKSLVSLLQCVKPDGSAVPHATEGHPMGIFTLHPILSKVPEMEHPLPFFYPYFLALSFMHCKNVELQDVPNDPSFVRRFTKWNKRPPVQYKELNIVPMQKVLRGVAAQHGTGMHQAMHICRGHFKDYRERGLFGKFKGIFWWDQTIRGSEDEGVIHKSYSVKPTADTPKPSHREGA